VPGLAFIPETISFTSLSLQVGHSGQELQIRTIVALHKVVELLDFQVRPSGSSFVCTMSVRFESGLTAEQIAYRKEAIAAECVRHLEASRPGRKPPAKSPRDASEQEDVPLPTQSSKIKVFISHSHADTAIAEALVALLQASLCLPDDAEIRATSVPGHELEFGDDFDLLRREVVGCAVVIGIVTRTSVESDWVLFELGARWGTNGKYMAPILYPGLTKNDLPKPLGTRNSASLAVRKDMSKLVDEVQKHAAVEARASGKRDRALDTFMQFAAGLRPPTSGDREQELQEEVIELRARLAKAERRAGELEQVVSSKDAASGRPLDGDTTAPLSNVNQQGRAEIIGVLEEYLARDSGWMACVDVLMARFEGTSLLRVLLDYQLTLFREDRTRATLPRTTPSGEGKAPAFRSSVRSLPTVIEEVARRVGPGSHAVFAEVLKQALRDQDHHSPDDASEYGMMTNVASGSWIEVFGIDALVPLEGVLEAVPGPKKWARVVLYNCVDALRKRVAASTPTVPVFLADGRDGSLGYARWRKRTGSLGNDLVAPVFDPSGLLLSPAEGTVIGSYWRTEPDRWRFRSFKVPTDEGRSSGDSPNEEQAREELLGVVAKVAPRIREVLVDSGTGRLVNPASPAKYEVTLYNAKSERRSPLLLEFDVLIRKPDEGVDKGIRAGVVGFGQPEHGATFPDSWRPSLEFEAEDVRGLRPKNYRLHLAPDEKVAELRFGDQVGGDIRDKGFRFEGDVALWWFAGLYILHDDRTPEWHQLICFVSAHGEVMIDAIPLVDGRRAQIGLHVRSGGGRENPNTSGFSGVDWFSIESVSGNAERRWRFPFK